MAARVQFEQFFTPQLARHLAAEPGLLRGADREVTLLFADVRSFSAHSERLGPEKTVEWINDVMNELSECVLAALRERVIRPWDSRRFSMGERVAESICSNPAMSLTVSGPPLAFELSHSANITRYCGCVNPSGSSNGR